MPVKIRQIRESIELPTVELGSGPITIIQRQINMTPNVQHNMLNCDLFMDNTFYEEGGEGWRGVVEVFVSPYPIIYTDMTINNFANRGPSAANNGILFKAILNGDTGGEFTTTLEGAQFPNKFATFNSEFDFYHPNLYITLIFHSTESAILKDVALSFLFTVSQKTVKRLTHTLGLWKEAQELMQMNISALGRSIAWTNNVGQIAPTWRWGGARPELMASAQTLSEFWYKTDTMEGEPTGSPTALRSRVTEARQMVENPDAFGTQTTGDSVPDWIAFVVAQGYESGPIREQWPPLKHDDNGNVLCL